MRLKILILSMCFASTAFISTAQSYNFGVRAGLNYSKFLGPAEEGVMEGYSLNNGFHFGLTFNYHLSDIAGIRSEFLYSQIGTKDSLVGPSYYIFVVNGERVMKEGYAKKTIDVSNAYISIPVMGYVRPHDDWELYGGVYFNFLVNPVAGGILDFDDQDTTLKFGFSQTLDHRYYTDEAGEGQDFGTPISVLIDDEDHLIAQSAGAYYLHQSKKGYTYNIFDMGLTAGFSYFVNKNLFIGLKADYGLLDVTNNSLDISFSEINDDGTFILRNDFDRNLAFFGSIGFRF